MTSWEMTRRSFLRTAALAVGGTLASCSEGVRAVAGDPFTLGVASGDPSGDSVVLWTRLATAPLEPGGGMAPEAVRVAWLLAEDEKFTQGLRSGEVSARPELSHSVHVEVPGLSPDRIYWYRFRAGDAESPVGRTRTFPAPGTASPRVRFGVASCSNFEQGFFTAYEHLLREDPAFVIHLGDYIYEGAGQDKKPRKHLGKECTTLEQYRSRYAQYRTDAALRALHAAVPWLVTPDDHEFDNNCANDISEEKGVLPADFLKRRAAAYQAYYENTPLRLGSLPKGPDMQLYRRLPWGRLADFHVLDTRQYRTDQPYGDGNKPPGPDLMDPKGTIMGAAQREWLFDGLVRSGASWNVLAQQVMIARVDRKPGEGVLYSMDQWPGYEFERRRLLKFLHERKIPNAVALSGDIHTNWANDLVADFDDLGSRIVATEFVGTSISSGGDGASRPKDLDLLLSDNPFVRFHNAERGYLKCELDAKTWRTDYRTVPFVLKPGAPLNTRASFVVEAGSPGLKPA
ncbi:MAG: alkaline phosphatase D family protein [Planctomycetes bacterium]|nr:alkaline phosphatase D family protein [Planctomycetota bacterium]